MPKPNFKDHISVSQINSWTMCRRRYMVESVFGFRSPGGPEAALGVLVHYCLEKLGDFSQASDEKCSAVIKGCINEAMAKNPANKYEESEQVSLLSVIDTPSLREKVLNCVLAVYRREREHKSDYKILANEYEFRINLDPRGNVVDEYVPGKSVQINGLIDRIDYMDGADILTVRDYKSGHWVYSRQQADEAPQATMYLMAIDRLIRQGGFLDNPRITAETRVRFIFDYVAEGVETHTSREIAQWQPFIDFLFFMDAERRSERMLKSPPTSLNAFCSSCGVRGKCKKYMAALKDDISERGFVVPGDDIGACLELYDSLDARGKIIKKMKDAVSSALVDHFMMEDTLSIVNGRNVEVCRRESISYDPSVCLDVLKRHNIVEECASFDRKTVDMLLAGNEKELRLLDKTAKKSMSSAWLRVDKAPRAPKKK